MKSEIEALLKAQAESLALSGFGDCLDSIKFPKNTEATSSAKIKAIEKSLGRLPDSYKEFLRYTNGLKHLDEAVAVDDAIEERVTVPAQ